MIRLVKTKNILGVLWLLAAIISLASIGLANPGSSTFTSLTSTSTPAYPVSWTKYSGNPVLTGGSLGQWDEGGVEFPAIIKDGDTFKMWYSSYPLSGASTKIGYATSTDGILWKKYSSNPVFLPSNNPGDWDSGGLGPCWVLKEGSVYKMWYRGRDVSSGGNRQIGYATSTDGITWVRKTPNTPVVTKGGPNDWDGTHASAPFVIYDSSSSQYKMWYHGSSNTLGLDGIGYAVSSDGINWAKYNDPNTGTAPYLNSDPVLRTGPAGTWDENEFSSASVVKDENLYHMWYNAADDTGYAYSLDGIQWTKYSGNPILSGDDPRVIKDGNTYKMWYSFEGDCSHGECIEALGYATSPRSVSPSVDIKANWSDGLVTLSPGNNLSITVALDNNESSDNADWWLAGNTPFGLYFYTFAGWTANLQPAYQGPLFLLPSFEVLNMPASALPAGTYTFYFGVDTVMDGNITATGLYFDSVQVNVVK